MPLLLLQAYRPLQQITRLSRPIGEASPSVTTSVKLTLGVRHSRSWQNV